MQRVVKKRNHLIAVCRWGGVVSITSSRDEVKVSNSLVVVDEMR
jgi:hypothetical protein